MNKKINALELKAQIARNGMTQSSLAEAMNIGWVTFWKKITGQNEFTVEEVRNIRDILELNDQAIKDIFLI